MEKGLTMNEVLCVLSEMFYLERHPLVALLRDSSIEQLVNSYNL